MGEPTLFEMRKSMQAARNNAISGAGNIMQPVQRPEHQRRKEVSHYLGVTPDRTLALYTAYSNGYQTYTLFSNEPIVNVLIAQANLLNWETTRNYITMQLNSHLVVLDCEKAQRGKYILQQLERAQIQINPAVKRTDLEEALSAFVRPWLDCVNILNRLDFTVHAGWVIENRYQQDRNEWTRIMRYQTADTAWNLKAYGEQFPVLTKRFQYVEPDAHDLRAYISAMVKLFTPENRLVMMVYPIMGILYSCLVGPNSQVPNIILNCIPLDSADAVLLAACLLVLNRDRQDAIDADMPSKKFEKILMDSKDEVLLIDTLVDSNDSEYLKQKKKKIISGLVKKVTERRLLDNGCHVRSAVALISDEVLRGNVINMTYEALNEEVVYQLRNSRIMEKVFSAVIRYVEKRSIEELQQIQRHQTLGNKLLWPLAVAYDVLRCTFDAYGIDLKKEAQLPEIDSLNSFFLDDFRDDNQRVNAFIDIVIRSRKELRACPVDGRRLDDENVFYYASDRIYFPKDVLENIFKNEHQSNFFKETLVILRAKGMLIANTGSKTTQKIIFDGNRIPTYCFERSMFDLRGWSDFVDDP